MKGRSHNLNIPLPAELAGKLLIHESNQLLGITPRKLGVQRRVFSHEQPMI